MPIATRPHEISVDLEGLAAHPKLIEMKATVTV